MKKIIYFFSFIFMFFALQSCDEQLEIIDVESIDSKAPITKPFETISGDNNIDYCGEPVECPLIAGQDEDNPAGTVTVRNDDENLYVTVYSKEGFKGSENVKIWVGTELPDKRPPAGHFPYKVTVPDGEKEVTIQIPYVDLGIDPNEECTPQEFYVLVHADVIANGNAETAWGGCEPGEGKAWWYYMEYTTQCCEEEIGFLYKTTNPEKFVTCFEDDGIFGFSNEIHYTWLAGANPDYPVWINVEDDCGIDNISYVGDIWFKILNPDSPDPEIELDIKMKDGNMIKDVEIYVGWENPVDSGGNLKSSIVFENIDVDADIYTYTKKVSTWAGIMPDPVPGKYYNPPFYVIVKMSVE